LVDEVDRPTSSTARTENEYVPGLRLNGVVHDQLTLVALRFSGVMRYQPCGTSTPQVPSLASASLVALLRSWISTPNRFSSSDADPLNVIVPPGATVSAGTETGGFITAGVVTDTDGSMPVLLTIQVRSMVSSEDCPAVSRGVTCICHWPSYGTVSSTDQVVLSPPGTSGAMLNEL
jgi:hypothetical protein